MKEKQKNNKTIRIRISLLLLLFLVLSCFCIYYFTGFFVVQPIGALPNGVTVWYVRLHTEMPFIESPDGIMLKRQGEVNLLGRAIVLGKMFELLGNKTICKLPYQKWLYLISTKGYEFEK